MSGAAAPLVVWLLAFSLAAVWNVAYAVYLLSRNSTWARYAWTGWAEFFRKFLKVRARAPWSCQRWEAQPLAVSIPLAVAARACCGGGRC